MSLNIAVVGPKGSFSEEAGLEFAGKQGKFTYAQNFDEIFDLVEDGKVNCGIIPFEDSIKGDVEGIIDLFRIHDVYIVHELHLDVTYALLGKESIDKLKVVGSHQRALDLCKKYLDTYLPHLSRRPNSSTSEAALFASLNSAFGAIAGEHAAEIYGLKVLRREIHDYGYHTTAFKVIAKHPLDWSGKPKGKQIFENKERGLAAYVA